MENTRNDKNLPFNEVALIVHTCDRYKILYKGFEYFFKKYWPYSDIKIYYYFLTEEEDYLSDIFVNIKTGKGQWTDRLQRGIKQIPQKYLIYIQEDMWLYKPVNADILAGVLKFVIANHTNLFKLTCNDVYKAKSIVGNINGYAVAILDNNKSRYLMSHQVSVWERSFLEAQIKFNENPWQNERRGTKRLKKLNPEIYQIDLISEYTYPPINNNANDSAMGSYYTVSKNAHLNSYAIPYIEQMKADADHGVRIYAAQLEYNVQNNLTHDGLGKPNKDDIFKKMKTFFLKLFK